MKLSFIWMESQRRWFVFIYGKQNIGRFLDWVCRLFNAKSGLLPAQLAGAVEYNDYFSAEG